MASKPRRSSHTIQDDVEIIDATIDAVTSSMPGGLTPGMFLGAAGRLVKAMATQPATTVRHTAGLGAEYVKIAAGRSAVEAGPRDRRFTDEAFSNNPLYKRLAQIHVAGENAVSDLLDDLDLDEKSRLRADFVSTLITSTTAPTNQLLGNPAALRRARETKGASLRDGARHALHDARHNGGMPSMVDTRPFVPGETVAVTPGTVVFQNAVLELIQYAPSTAKVYERPIFIIPPQINRYYILDLAPGRSMIEHLVDQGQQVYGISFRNPGPEQRDWSLDTYLAAILEAMDAAMEISGSPDLNLLGVCAGGITAAVLLGHLAAIGDERIHAASFLVTILDWDVPSTLGSTFISRPILAAGRRQSQSKGILSGDDLGKLFAWLRPNDLVWNYWVNNYLLGKNPPAFDVLAWNVDATNLPAGLHADFLDMALENGLLEPGKVIGLDTPIDLSKVTCESFVVGAVTDHITPWKACYPTVNLLGGPSEFVLSSQGHIQALVNPSGNPKGKFYTNPATPNDADEWEADAVEHTGSWWDHWTTWLAPRSGKKKTARKTAGSDKYPAGVAAPGVYVLE